MLITSIERNKKNKDRLSVCIDNRYSFSISEDDYLSLNLYDKKEITEEEVQYIKDVLNFRAAKSTAVRYLSLKLRPEIEIRAKLENEGYDTEIADRVIEELKALGYINNRLYIQKYVFDRSKLKPKSKKMLKLELKSRGLPEEEIDEVLDEWKVDEAVVAEGLVKKKFGKYDLKDEKIIKKVYSFLLHRGYSYEIVDGIIKKINNGSGF